MSDNQPLAFDRNPSELPLEPRERHEAFVDLFGQVLFWLRNYSLDASQRLIESEEARTRLGTIRREPYERAARMSPEERAAAMRLSEATLDGFAERLVWLLGDEGTDSRFGTRHAYRFRIEMEIVDVQTGEVVEQETINRGGKFFGSYWGRWRSRFGRE